MNKKLFIILAASLFFCTFSFGQKIDNRFPGGFPIVDTLDLKAIRSKLEEIKKTRPTVALVLSGGGAKGAAHVGVIKYIEELGIPVDVVLGTSMGGLVGGFYSLGYDVEELEEIIRTIDWNSALTDDISRDYISYAENKYREKYVLSIPFYYDKKEFLRMRGLDGQLAELEHKYDALRLGAEEESNNKSVKDNLLGSLPAGFIFGQNVNNILSSYTVGYQDDIKFGNLPKPFVCVATEMVTGKAKIWTAGKLNVALRSTMSIPGIFSPVRVDGMVLVDGGMRDNYPTDIARSLEPDFIIGVDLSQGFRGYHNLNNLAEIIWQGVDMLGRESYERNYKETEVTIKPKLSDYNMMSFDKASIDTIMRRGYAAAEEQGGNLLAIKALIGERKSALASGRKATNINKTLLNVSGIEITGVSEQESLYLMGKFKMDITKPVSRDEINNAVATIYGTKSFDYVTYELQGENEPYRLRINCKKGPLNKLGLGVRIDSEEIVSLLLNFGWNVHKLQGSALDVTGKIGVNPYLDLRYYYLAANGPTFNARAKFHYTGRSTVKLGEAKFTSDYSKLMEEIYFSNISWSKFDLRLGIRNEFYKINSIFTDNINTVTYDLNTMRNSFVSLFLNARADTFDRGYFPKKGLTVGLDYYWVFAGLQYKIVPFSSLQFDTKSVFSIGERFSILPSLNLRFIFGKAEDLPLPYINVAGGSMAGRYFDQQLPFIGVNDIFAADNMLMILRSDFRFKLFKNNYLSAIVNVADTFPKIKDIINFNNSIGYVGAGLEYAYDSIIGPIKADLHWSSVNKKIGIYLSVGYDF